MEKKNYDYLLWKMFSSQISNLLMFLLISLYINWMLYTVQILAKNPLIDPKKNS
jgi:hypothetical protein